MTRDTVKPKSSYILCILLFNSLFLRYFDYYFPVWADALIEGVNQRDFGTNNSKDVQNFCCFYSVYFHVFIVFFREDAQDLVELCTKPYLLAKRFEKIDVFRASKNRDFLAVFL